MSVAAMTMDEQRLNSSYNKANSTNPAGFVSGPASPQSPQYSQQQQPHHHHQQHQHQQEQEQQSFNEQRLLQEIEALKDEQARLAQQFADSQRREKVLTRRLANKEQEFQDYVSQIAEYKAAQAPCALALRSALLDPAVNLLFEKLKKELKATKAKLEETQNELSAWKFTPDSNTGKRLMAKCRLLYQENEELGKMTSSGRLAKLETELAMQKSFSEEVKKSQSELDDFLQELDEDVEGMQSTILFLQQELKTTRERIQLLEKQNEQLKNGAATDDSDALNKDNETDANSAKALAANELATHALSLNGNNNGVEAIKSNFLTVNNAEKLLPIQEEPCERITAYVCGDVSGYNGSSSTTEEMLKDEQSLRTATTTTTTSLQVTRKRTYDNLESSNEHLNANDNLSIISNAAPLQQQLAATAAVALTAHVPHVPHTIAQVVAPPTPRTLPPKKSKLRMTPPTMMQQTTDSLLELRELNENATAMAPITSISHQIHETLIVDAAENAAVSIDEHAAGNNGNVIGVPQRIMTRRRSMRSTQQNGA